MTVLRTVDGVPDVKLGRYVLRRELASGGMARVFLSQLDGAAGFQRWVAVKVIHPNLAKDSRFIDMLLDEARVTSNIHHPNVCSILDFGGGRSPHIVMEYIHGESFAKIMQSGWPDRGLPYWFAARVISDTARGVNAAHELKDASGRSLNIVHRDISPQNIMVHYDGIAKILDFGIARARGKIVHTGSFEIKGRVVICRRSKSRIGLWIGEPTCGHFRWCCGKRRSVGTCSGARTTERRRLTWLREIPKPSSIIADYPKELEDIVMRGLDREIGDRYQSAAELADALDAFLWNQRKQAGPNQVSDWMKREFADDFSKREQFIRSVTSCAPPAEMDEFDDSPTQAAPQL
ncbi:MAG: serine/threonine-protein kinase [Polyangiales bacterium]